MTRIPGTSRPQSDSDVYSVGRLNREVRLLLEHGMPVVWVEAELSNFSRPGSGHWYFTLKDRDAQVRCAMFRSRAQLLSWKLENGQQVEVQALVTLYEARGDFQLNVEGMRRAGIGRLYELFLKLREKLAGEGLFAPEHKRPLPLFPRYAVNASGEEWPVQPRLLKIREWLRTEGFRQTQALKAEVGGGSYLRVSVSAYTSGSLTGQISA